MKDKREGVVRGLGVHVGIRFSLFTPEAATARSALARGHVPLSLSTIGHVTVLFSIQTWVSCVNVASFRHDRTFMERAAMHV